MPDNLMERLMRAIVPCRMRVKSVEGTWKLGQNKPAAARLGPAAGLAQAGPEGRMLADLMRALPDT